MAAVIPALILSEPNVGPTVLSSIIFTGAGKLPALRIITRSLLSSIEKEPVILASPLGILSSMVGAT